MTDIQTTTATFEIDLRPADGLLDGTDRFDFTKRWDGGMPGRSTGTMLSAGDPGSGAAGYVAIERFEGQIDGRSGSVALQQLGRMSAGEDDLRYEIVPGSGTGDLAGITGEIALDITDGHAVRLTYRFV